jgi:hypothetical protein
MRTSIARVVARYLAAAPLDDYYSLPSPTGTSDSVGWGREKSKPFLRAVTTYFEARKDSWAIIVVPKEVKRRELGLYVESNPKLKRCKIIAVDSESMEGDETAPKWVVLHDIIGHGIQFLALTKMPEHETIVRNLHAALPRQFKITKDPDDLLPDIYAAIFFRSDLRGLVQTATEIGMRQTFGKVVFDPQMFAWKQESVQKLFQKLQEDVARWTSSFTPGVPKLIELW